MPKDLSFQRFFEGLLVDFCWLRALLRNSCDSCWTSHKTSYLWKVSVSVSNFCCNKLAQMAKLFLFFACLSPFMGLHLTKACCWHLVLTRENLTRKEDLSMKGYKSTQHQPAGFFEKQTQFDEPWSLWSYELLVFKTWWDSMFQCVFGWMNDPRVLSCLTPTKSSSNFMSAAWRGWASCTTCHNRSIKIHKALFEGEGKMNKV